MMKHLSRTLKKYVTLKNEYCISRAWNHGDTTKRVGAVESLIWDYATELGELGHEGTIINTPDRTQIIVT